MDNDLPNFSIDFDFLHNDNSIEDVSDDIFISLKETWSDKTTTGEENKWNQKHSHNELNPQDGNAASRPNNVNKKNKRAHPSSVYDKRLRDTIIILRLIEAFLFPEDKI